jgi:hypothetical protein
MMLAAFLSEIQTVWSRPFTRKPRISFSWFHWVSPFFSFFIDMGFLPPWWPVTAGGGKIEWIPCRVLRAILPRSVPSAFLAVAAM